jgi:predicted TIM-barrel fold metal-dependent hydrolase
MTVSDATGLPRLISVDDHVVEPPDLWWSRLPRQVRDRGPHVRRERGVLVEALYGRWSPQDEDGQWADVWYYDDMVRPLQRGLAQSGYDNEETSRPITYEEVLRGAYQREARLVEMDHNHTDVSICFPSVSRFCGQTFLDRKDKEVALLCVQAYNDWMIEEWCGPARPARLVPLTLVPLWDVDRAAAEIRRCAARGSHAASFPESPPALGLPSIYSDYWDPLLAACQETDTVLNLHVGSSSTRVTTAPDAPIDLAICFLFVNSELAFADWLYSGILAEFPDLRIVLSEGQVGWMPFVMQRIDNTWKKCLEGNKASSRRASELPSNMMRGHIFGSIFDDLQGLIDRDAIGMEQIMIETDFPHKDSTYPHSEKVVSELVTAAGLDDNEVDLLVRGNAITVYGLDKYFGISS